MDSGLSLLCNCLSRDVDLELYKGIVNSVPSAPNASSALTNVILQALRMTLRGGGSLLVFMDAG